MSRRGSIRDRRRRKLKKQRCKQRAIALLALGHDPKLAELQRLFNDAVSAVQHVEMSQQTFAALGGDIGALASEPEPDDAP